MEAFLPSPPSGVREESADCVLVHHPNPYPAFSSGELVARGAMIMLPSAGFLSGAGTLERARGRGAFRALVRARWDEAERRDTPALIVGAGAMSRPILEQLGFRMVAEIHVLVDSSA